MDNVDARPLLVNEGDETCAKTTTLSYDQDNDLRYKIVKSTLLAFAFISWGLSDTVIIPSMDDLRVQMQCNYEQISHILIGKSVGTMVGAVSAAFLIDRFQRQGEIILGSSLVIGNVLLGLSAWCKSLPLMSFAYFIFGGCFGAVGCGGNALTAWLWGASAVVPLLLVHLGYSLGTIAGPAIAGPFLTQANTTNNVTLTGQDVFISAISSLNGYTPMYWQGHNHMYQGLVHDAEVYNNEFNDSSAYLVEDHRKEQKNSQLYIPFGIVGLIGIFNGIMFYILAFYNAKYRSQKRHNEQLERPNLLQIVHPGTCSDGKLLYGSTMLSLVCALYVFLNGKDNPVFNFVTVLAVDGKLHFSSSEGTFLTSMFFLSYCAGRLLFALIGLVVRVQVLIFVEFAFQLGTQVLMIIFAYDSKTTFWVFMLLYAFAAGPMFPSGMGWINRYLTMTTMAYAVITIGASIGGFVFSWMAGYLLQYYSALSVFYLALVCCVAALAIMSIMQVIGTRHGDRFDQQRQVIITRDVTD